MVEKESPRSGKVLTEVSSALVSLHREHFGRGPSAAKSFVADDVVVCVLSDVYTQVERTLIAAGQLEHVRETRMLHQLALEDEYKEKIEAILDRPVEAFLSVVHVDPDVAVQIFILGGEPVRG